MIFSSNVIIDKNTTYRNTHLDLNKGSFLITKGAVLTLEDCVIDGTISPTNRFMINVANGELRLKNNTIHVAVDKSLLPNPLHPSLYYIFTVTQGLINIVGNTFISDKSYVIGFFSTTKAPTENIIIKNNNISNFHGGILLDHTKNAFIFNNKFTKVSGGNIFIISGDNILISKNNILFAGNNSVGDGIDISDSHDVSIIGNYILSGSCYSLMVLRGENILIDNNKIIGGITYGIFINTSFGQNVLNAESGVNNSSVINTFLNKNIVVSNNYLSQNRYALSGKNINGLTVKNNIIIQHFTDSNNRKFWTNNDMLFQNVYNFIWENNFYKEAFSQDINDRNAQSLKMVSFPLHGGVVL